MKSYIVIPFTVISLVFVLFNFLPSSLLAFFLVMGGILGVGGGALAIVQKFKGEAWPIKWAYLCYTIALINYLSVVV